MKLKRVVVTGLGSLTPIGNTYQDFWKNLLSGVSGADLIKHFDASSFKTKFACEVKGFNVFDFVETKDARKMDVFTQYAVVASGEAIKDAKIDLTAVDLERVGVILGSGMGGTTTTFQEISTHFKAENKEDAPRLSPFFIPKVISDIASGQVAIQHGFKGINYLTASACASAANAIADAFNYIRLGKADIIVSGGSEAPVNELGVAGFNAMHAISTRNDSPQTASRPLDKDRDGFVIGEGAGILILEELEHAKRRGATIYAEISGSGMSADAYHITTPHPEGLGAKLAMKTALEDANLPIESVDHINMHCTSTLTGDIIETKAISALFGEHAYKINLNAIKSMIGHLLGAAGAVEAIATVLAVKNDIVPPTINHFNLAPEIDPELNFTFNEAQKRTVNVAISNSFGFGGHNTSLVFKKYED